MNNPIEMEEPVEGVGQMELGEASKQELKRLQDGQRQYLREQLKAQGRIAWDDELIASVCAAVGTMFGQILWDSSDESGSAIARLEPDHGERPVVKVVPHKGSRMERRNGSQGEVRLLPDEVAAYIAPQCGLKVEEAKNAWVSLARALPEALDVLPGVEIDRDPSGFLVRLPTRAVNRTSVF